jgi:hypothetical protein
LGNQPDRDTATSRPLDRGDPLLDSSTRTHYCGGCRAEISAAPWWKGSRTLLENLPGLARNFRQSRAFPADLPTFSFCSRGAERLEFGKNPFDF